MPTYIFDDVFGDQRPGSNSPLPVYSPPSNQWDPVHGTCSQCSMSTNIPVPVDTSQVMNGTWHTVTVNPGEAVTNVTFTFTGKYPQHVVNNKSNDASSSPIGTSVTAYCMLPPYLQPYNITAAMNVTFQLDGNTVGFYKYSPSTTTEDWTYHQNVFSTSGLKNEEHIFAISPQGQDGDRGANYYVDSSFLVFDYITYE